MHRDKLFCQIDGVTMGSPLGPTLANFFLAHLETQFMKENRNFAPELYLRYVDDIFCAFTSNAYVIQFLEFLNSLHANLRFTFELGPDRLAFLDTHISLPTNDFDSVSSTVYRKPSNTNVILNFAAVCPWKWKSGLITCFINRAYTVCSTWQLFHSEMTRLRNIFRENGYPSKMFDRCLGTFLDKKQQQTPKIAPIDLEFTPIICLPYTGHPSLNFSKQLKSIFRSGGVTVRVIFRSFRVGQLFSLKSATPFDLRAKVVYRFQCPCDKGMSYIGKTKRHLVTRSKEHFSGQRSAISDHLKECPICRKNADIDKFSILATANSDFELRIKEALYIKSKKPRLNRQLSQQGSAFFLNVF